MADTSTKSSSQSKKLLENPLVGSLVVPIAIILIGAVIIFGVTKMLSTDRSYKDLVREMHSKTFGNRWIAAYELSKLISTAQIPQEDLPWLVDNLKQIYQETADDRTREFLVVAVGALRTPLSVPLLEMALESKHGSIQFHALVALGNLPAESAPVSWAKVLPFLESEDPGLKQAAILALASHRVAEAERHIELLLNDASPAVRYAAATALVYYKNAKALPTLSEILLLPANPSAQSSAATEGNVSGFKLDQVTNLKLNIVKALETTQWDKLIPIVEGAMQKEENNKVLLYEQQVLNKLKN